MHHFRFRLLPIVFVGVLFALSLIGCSERPVTSFQGYAEGESLHIAAPFAGSLEQLYVARGEQVAANAPLFTLEKVNEAAQRQEAQARVAGATARLANLQTGRRKPLQ